jgi:uncharacterized repeat protein (TIGR01451 family)
MNRSTRFDIVRATCLLLALSVAPALAALRAGGAVVLSNDAGPASAAPEVTLGALSFILDDGVAENDIGDVGQFIWINRFTPAPADFPFQLEEVRVAFGTTLVPVGGAMEIVIHQDTDNDGNPGTGATFVASHTGTVQFNDGATFSVYTLVPPVVLNGPGDVLVGVINRYGAEGTNDFPATLDQTATQGRSWAASYLAGNVPANPTYPADEQWGTIDSFGFPGNWLVRAFGTRIVDADLSITKSGIESPPGTVVYTLTVGNAGPVDATNVVVTDPLPAELAYVSDDCGGVNGAPWTWSVGNLADGASVVCNITLSVVTPGAVVNTASVSGDQTDPNGANDAATATLTVTGVPDEGSILEVPALGRFGLLALLTLLAAAGVALLARR